MASRLKVGREQAWNPEWAASRRRWNMGASFSILYQDDDLIAVSKPAGLKMHRDGYDRPRADVLLGKVRSYADRWVYPVHRLDQPASGVVLFALSPEVARIVSDQFRNRQVEKTYLAVTRGYLAADGCIDAPLTRDAYAPKRGQMVKDAWTYYKRLATVELDFPVGRYATCRYSLAAIYPRTGRMHQIRRHFRHIRHPLIGDTTYGDARHNRFFRTHFGCGRLLLAAVQLHLAHPRSGSPLHLDAPLNSSFRDVLQQLGWLNQVPAQWRKSMEVAIILL